MAGHIYRVTEIVGSSADSVEAAIRNGIERAARTVRHIDWFEVTQVRGFGEDGQIGFWDVQPGSLGMHCVHRVDGLQPLNRRVPRRKGSWALIKCPLTQIPGSFNAKALIAETCNS